LDVGRTSRTGKEHLMGWLWILGTIMVLAFIGAIADFLNTKFKLRVGVTWCVALLMLVGGCIAYFDRLAKEDSRRDTALAPFLEHLQTYQQSSRLTGPGTEAYTRGRVIVLDVYVKSAETGDSPEGALTETMTLSRFTFDLPDVLQPRTPAEVGTVLQLTRYDEYVGSYTNTKNKAYRRCCKVKLIDPAIPAVIATRTFQGSSPSAGDLYGSSPDSDIIKWISGLPHKQQ
jgi:hypothetical protein